MCPSTSCPLSSFTRNIVLGRASGTSPSISILSPFARVLLLTANSRGFSARDASGPGPPARPSSDLLDVYGLRALVALLFLIGHLRGLAKRLEAIPADAGVMHEQVAAAVVGCDEAVALLVVEPLDGPGCHLRIAPFSPG